MGHLYNLDIGVDGVSSLVHHVPAAAVQIVLQPRGLVDADGDIRLGGAKLHRLALAALHNLPIVAPADILLPLGVQQGHIQHYNVYALLFFQYPPLFQNLGMVAPRLVDTFDVQQGEKDAAVPFACENDTKVPPACRQSIKSQPQYGNIPILRLTASFCKRRK